MKKIKIYEVSGKTMEEIMLDSTFDKEVDNVLFLGRSQNKYIAIDNENGNFIIEEFPNKNKALFWLIRTDYAHEEILNMRNDKIEKLLEEQKYQIISLNKKRCYGI